MPNNSQNAVNSDLPECLILSQYHPAVLSFSYFKGILIFQQCDSWEPEPQLRLPSVYPFINSSQSWDPAMLRSGEDGTASSLAETGQVQAGTSHTEMLIPPFKESCLPVARTAVHLNNAYKISWRNNHF